MKLQDGPLVQWKDGATWHTGCLVINAIGDVVCGGTGPTDFAFAQEWRINVLVKHGYTGELETVDASLLTIRPNEHPE